MNKLSRRQFLQATGMGGAVLALAACAPVSQAPAESAAPGVEVTEIDWWTVAGADVGSE